MLESAVLAYECVLPPLDTEQLAAYYAESMARFRDIGDLRRG